MTFNINKGTTGENKNGLNIIHKFVVACRNDTKTESRARKMR